MAEMIIPRREQELIAADARRLYGGDDEKVATAITDTAMVDGIQLVSRYSKAHELDAMIRMVEAVRPELRVQLLSIFCDSKAGACYTVKLRCILDADRLHDLGEELETGARGHNGIWIEFGGDTPFGGGETFHVVNPNWDD